MRVKCMKCKTELEFEEANVLSYSDEGTAWAFCDACFSEITTVKEKGESK